MSRFHLSTPEYFYGLWFPLLDFVNKKLKVDESIDLIDEEHPVSIEIAEKISDELWKHTALIDEYIEANDFDANDEAVLLSWKKPVHGIFAIERHLQKGSVFIDECNVYLVKPLFTPWKEMFPDIRTPFYVKCTLLPIDDEIITTGIIRSYSKVKIGRNIALSLKEKYLHAKNNGILLKNLYVNHTPYYNLFLDYIHDLSNDVQDMHIYFVTFFLFDYLEIEELSIREGAGCISDFINKHLWSSEEAYKENIASIKLFYKCMLENEVITSEDYNRVLETIEKFSKQ